MSNQTNKWTYQPDAPQALSVPGQTTGTTVPAGIVGQQVIARQSGLGSVATSTYTNLVSITLTAGSWLVYFMCNFEPASNDYETRVICAISSSSSSSSSTLSDQFYNLNVGSSALNQAGLSGRVGPYNYNSASGTTLYGNVEHISHGGTASTIEGVIVAYRVS